MSDIPGNLKYSRDHEWVKTEADGVVTVGITDHAQQSLGDMVYVETPEVGAAPNAGDACATVESVKAASDIYSPISGEVTEVNPALTDNPELVNSDPYGDGWIFRLRPGADADMGGLLDADAYAAHCEDAD